jgi:hypothetical protein
VRPAEGGTVRVSPRASRFARGAVVSLIPQSAPGYAFAGWEEIDSTASELSLVLTEDLDLTPRFVRMIVPRITTSGDGSVDVSPDNGAFRQGETIELTATPSAGWQFAGWQGASTATSRRVQHALASDVAFHASFVQSYESFAAEIFTDEQLLDDAIAGPQADADYDGHLNLVEYIMGSDPTAPESRPDLSYRIQDEALVLSFRKIANRESWKTEVQHRDETGSWTTEGVTERSTELSETDRMVEATVPIIGAQPTLVRIRFAGLPASE